MTPVASVIGRSSPTALQCRWGGVAVLRRHKGTTISAGQSLTRATLRATTCAFSIGAGRCQALSDFSIDPVLMSVAGSALLFGIGTEALP